MIPHPPCSTRPYNPVPYTSRVRSGARACQSPHAEEHLLGVIIRRDGETWFVPFNGSPDREYEVDGPPRRVSSELPRSARYCFDIADPVLLSIQSAHASSGDESEAMVGFENDAAFLAEFETGPAYGEFVDRKSTRLKSSH